MPESLTFCGRTFGADELELMRQMSREYSALGVTEIARTVCELLHWTRSNGGLKNGGRMDPGHQGNPHRWQAPRANASPWNWLW
jgi:hypothetical protein